MNCPHCNTNIDEHEAFRCLDAWVAEAVMGLVQCQADFHGDAPNCYAPKDSSKCGSFLEDYSTDISAAWEVVEKVNQDNAMTLRWYNPDGRTSIYSVAFGFGKKAGAEADTAPLAICRASIKACVSGEES